MEKVRKKTLIRKLLLFVLPLSIVSIAVTGVVLTRNNYSYFLRTIDRDYRNLLMCSAYAIDIEMKSHRRNLEGLARVLSATKLDRWRQEIALKAFNERSSNVMSVSLLSTDGRAIVSSGWTGADEDRGTEPLFVKVLQGRSVFSEILLTRYQIPYVHFGAPVRTLGEVSGVLWSDINLKVVWDLMERLRIGQTDQVYIMNLSGQVIVDRNIVPVAGTPPKTSPEILDQLAGLDGSPMHWTEERGNVKYFCLGSTIPSLGWVVVLRQTSEEAYSYLYRNIRWAAAISLIVCLMTVLLSWYLVRQFLRPINLLHQQVQKIGQGDLDQKVDVRSEDEIGDLSETFNQMTDSLKRLIEREVLSATELAHARSLAVLGTASAKVTHEISNLLSNITLSTMMLKRERLSSGGERSIEILEKESARVKAFIQNFLQFAKKPELCLQKVSIEEVAKEVLFVQGPQAAARDIAITLDCPPGLPLVAADSRLIYQALNNLVKNGLEAMEHPGRIAIRGSVEDHWLKVTVEDTGPGMGAEVLGRVFDPFFTTKGKGGTGLGLSVCKSILEAHRGSIECLSEQGAGTTFILRLPL